MAETRHLLVERRDQLGLSQADVARLIGCDVRSYGKVERGEATPRRGETRQRYARALQLSTEQLAVALGAASTSNGKGAAPGWLTLYAGLEQQAASVRNYEATVIPGLCQTRAYAEAMLRSDITDRTDADIARLVEMRLARQEALHRAADPLQLHAVFDEVALRRVAGSPAVMVELVDHLVELADRQNVELQVLPIAAGAHPFGFGSFVILDSSNDLPAVVYVESRSTARYLESEAEVEAHAAAFEHLAELALTPAATVEFIRQLRET